MMHVDLNKKDIKRFFANYNVGEVLNYQRIKKGFANVVVVVKTNKGKYILKIVIRNMPDNRVRYEVDLLNFMKGLPTPRPIAAKNGEYLINYSRDNKAFIYRCLPGRQLTRFNKSKLRQVGRFLGRMHLQTIKFKSSVKRLEFYNVDKKNFKEIIRATKKIKNREIQKRISYIEKNLLQYLLPKSLPWGGMHIDCKPENALFTKGKLIGMIDFDNSYNGPLVLDLANTMMWFCSKEGVFDLDGALAIYRGYKQVRKLSKQENEYLFDAFHFASLTHVLVDIYLSAPFRLPFSYIKWCIDNLLETEKNLTISKEEFKKIFN